ncbi:MAG: hypothetical protein HYX85_00105 [Chloroflexi bacterium]|nr:hypothetical protein [Chloroflexota bacterium]
MGIETRIEKLEGRTRNRRLRVFFVIAGDAESEEKFARYRAKHHEGDYIEFVIGKGYTHLPGGVEDSANGT